MGVLARRVLGVVLLALAVAIPSCQAVFPRDAAQAPHAITHGSLPH